MKKTIITSTSLAFALLANAPVLANEQAFSFEKLLQVNPKKADEFVLLKSEIQRLKGYVEEARLAHEQSVKAFADYQSNQQTQLSNNQQQVLKEQLRSRQYQQDIDASASQLGRLQSRLLSKTQQLENIKRSIDADFIANHALNIDTLKQRLLSGERIELLPGQTALLIQAFEQLGSDAPSLATALQHQDIQHYLPEYLKEQFIQLQDSGISLTQALQKSEVKAAVMNGLAINKPEQATASSGMVLSVYEVDDALIAQTAASPISIQADLDAKLMEFQNLVELYDIPVPSEEVVTSQPEPTPDPNNPDLVYEQLGDFAIDKFDTWPTLPQEAITADNQQQYMSDLQASLGPQQGELTSELPTEATARYKGEMAGSYLDGSDTLSGAITLDVSFNGNSNTQLSGSFQLQDSQDRIAGVIQQTTISGPSNFSAPIEAGDGQKGALTGSFFGSAAQEVGGVWALGVDSRGGKAAVGRFKAKK